MAIIVTVIKIIIFHIFFICFFCILLYCVTFVLYYIIVVFYFNMNVNYAVYLLVFWFSFICIFFLNYRITLLKKGLIRLSEIKKILTLEKMSFAITYV